MAATDGAALRPPVPRRPTLKDVAARAGVSIKTASRVLNGEGGATQATHARVREASRELNYRRNINAGSIRRNDRRTASIGLIVDDISNPFFAALTRIIENETRRRGHLLLAGSSDRSADQELALITEFVTRQVDGLIIAPCREDPPHLERELGDHTPVVFLDGLIDGGGFDAVLSDNVRGLITAVDHLAAHGHRAIAYLGENAFGAPARERYQGYLDGMARHQLTVHPPFVAATALLADESDRSLTAMLGFDPRPTAVIAGNNSVTIGALRALNRAGLQHKIALIGFDDLDLAGLVSPKLTVIAQNVQELGRTVTDRLFARIERPDHTPGVTIRIPTTLIPRGSGEIPLSQPS